MIESAAELASAPVFAEAFSVEDAVLAAARTRAGQVGCISPTPSCGAALRLLAAALDARAIVEVGTGTGVSGLWMLGGMRPDGVLTSIDVEPEHQRLARQAFGERDVRAGQIRLINGRALEVLPRLADESYDMVAVVNGVRTEYLDYLVEALRLLRPGGIVAFNGVLAGDGGLAGGRATEPVSRDPESQALSELLHHVREHDRLISAVLPIGDGLLAIAKGR